VYVIDSRAKEFILVCKPKDSTRRKVKWVRDNGGRNESSVGIVNKKLCMGEQKIETSIAKKVWVWWYIWDNDAGRLRRRKGGRMRIN